MTFFVYLDTLMWRFSMSTPNHAIEYTISFPKISLRTSIALFILCGFKQFLHS